MNDKTQENLGQIKYQLVRMRYKTYCNKFSKAYLSGSIWFQEIGEDFDLRKYQELKNKWNLP